MAEKLNASLAHSKVNYSFVCAIDFGTAYSGYAYGSVADLKNSQVSLNREWVNRLGVSSFKTATTVLTGPNGQCEEYGFDAEFKYMKLLEMNDAPSQRIYRYFKMLLHHEQEITSQTLVPSEDGHPRAALEIFAMAITYLKEHFLNAVAEARGIQLETKEVLWVLTVPAIWSEKSKRFMRQAAKKGGLIQHEDSRKLLLALEPEAASIYCQTLQLDQFHGHMNIQSRSHSIFATGTKHLIVDAGGGTVDMTAHEVLPNGDLKELITASGGDWGGMQINDHFNQLLKEHFGTEFISQLRKESQDIWINLQMEFEKKKRATKPDGNTVIHIDVNIAFGEYVQEKLHKTIKEILPESQGRSLYYRNGKIVITATGVLDLFHSNIGQINRHLRKVLTAPKLKGLKYIFLVGGYAQSEYLYKAMKLEFPKHIILVPEKCSSAIMEGAVLYGYKPNRIVTRIARKTYGCCIRRTFEEDVHDPEKAVFDEFGKKYCDLVFRKFVSKGEEVAIERPYIHYTAPFQSDASHVTKRLYYTDKENPMYVDEEGVHWLGDLRIDMEDIIGGKERDIKTTVIFSGTEMQVTASVEGQCDVKVMLDFLSDHR